MNEGRFSWPHIFRAAGIIVGGAAVVAVAAPLIWAFSDGNGPASTADGFSNTLVLWLVWAVAWGLTFLMGQRMIKEVGDKIIDDMLVTGITAALGILIVKVVTWIFYVQGLSTVLPISPVDGASFLVTVVVALVAARINQY
jgi:hypothetical protein